MISVCKGTSEDFDKIRDFANYVFSQNERPHDFKKLLPKVYEDGQDTTGNHYLIKDGNDIKAMLCVWKVELQIFEHSLKAACIGTVSVHPYSRGNGYMKLLMNAAIDDMKTEGCEFAFLGGQRQRYEYFGFEPSGIQLNYIVTKTNIHHNCKETDASKIEFVTLCNKDKWINCAYQLYQSQAVKIARTKEDFPVILRSWESEPYAILNDGVFAGYFTWQTNGTISELLLSDQGIYRQVLKSIVNVFKTDSINLTAAPYETEKLQFLSVLAESCTVKSNHNYLILNWGTTLVALLNLKSKYESLADGTLSIIIDQTAIKITVADQKIYVGKADQEADMALSSLNAANLLFSPVGSLIRNKYIENLDKQKQLCFNTWFPLPLYTAPADGC